MIGPPGAGKSMLAARLPSILPPLLPAELLEVSMIAWFAGEIEGGALTNRGRLSPQARRTPPRHAASLDIQVRARRAGLAPDSDPLPKIANGATEAQGNGAGFYGKPYQPGAVVKNDIEYIVFMRKGGEYRKTTMLQKALSMLSKAEMQGWFSSFWDDIRGASTRNGHPAPYPVEVAERLVRMFSFAGDTVLDPFLGTGSTSIAAIRTGRNSVGNEIEPKYLKIARARIRAEVKQPRTAGSSSAILT